LLLSSLLVGAWAQLAPGAFWEGFRGFGYAWVSVDGPYNEHLVRDVAGLQLAVAVFLLAALLRPTTTLVLIAALSSLAWQAPHAVYHLFHVGDLPTPADRVAQSGVLLISLAVAVLLLVAALPRDASADTSRKG
jgi:hypothetical protein